MLVHVAGPESQGKRDERPQDDDLRRQHGGSGPPPPPVQRAEEPVASGREGEGGEQREPEQQVADRRCVERPVVSARALDGVAAEEVDRVGRRVASVPQRSSSQSRQGTPCSST